MNATETTRNATKIIDSFQSETMRAEITIRGVTFGATLTSMSGGFRDMAEVEAAANRVRVRLSTSGVIETNFREVKVGERSVWVECHEISRTPTAYEIENGTYTTEQLSAMGGKRAWSVHIPAEERQARDAARSELIGEAIESIHEYEASTGLAGAAEIKDGAVVAICEVE